MKTGWWPVLSNLELLALKHISSADNTHLSCSQWVAYKSSRSFMGGHSAFMSDSKLPYYFLISWFDPLDPTIISRSHDLPHGLISRREIQQLSLTCPAEPVAKRQQGKIAMRGQQCQQHSGPLQTHV
ncbi:TPA: hypothetical protein ACH3X1_006248 [Trebouxia sp. C0004]